LEVLHLQLEFILGVRHVFELLDTESVGVHRVLHRLEFGILDELQVLLKLSQEGVQLHLVVDVHDHWFQFIENRRSLGSQQIEVLLFR